MMDGIRFACAGHGLAHVQRVRLRFDQFDESDNGEKGCMARLFCWFFFLLSIGRRCRRGDSKGGGNVRQCHFWRKMEAVPVGEDRAALARSSFASLGNALK
ncbi:hypothetical protein E2562_039160 [Oryza meyeriana var. granulata]|uniref:Uncharacterized protein n=1 Tax=Oryza meyeriana var. granulata TaxID=110450 RepID=A0A6G1CKW6_9ORYZ|nr:hypothetical protein E2562_039160 [Oryza meyeriana var. granulata]